MKKFVKVMIPLALTLSIATAMPVLAVVGQPNTGEEVNITESPNPETAPLGNSNTFWGTLSVKDDVVMLNNGNSEMGTEQIMLRINANTLILDAVTGIPIKLEDIREDETVYAYTDVKMLPSMPPQTSALVIIANIPADFGVPGYHTITAVNTMEDGNVEVTTDHNDTLVFDAEDSYLPYLTRQMMNITDLEVGSRILVWSAYEGNPADGGVYSPYKVMFLPALSTEEDNDPSDIATVINGKVTMYSIRDIAEDQGYSVGWNDGQGCVELTIADETAPHSILIATNTVTMGNPMANGMVAEELNTPVVYVDGASYLSAQDAQNIFGDNT